jgi:type IV secretory pathway VirB10-like protein
MRQRAVVKIHYFGHGGGGGAALKAHARYVAREAATLEREGPSGDLDKEQDRAHSAYLSRSGREPFYDAREDNVDGAVRASAWASSDRRHFRIILAPENGAEIKDLRGYSRELAVHPTLRVRPGANVRVLVMRDITLRPYVEGRGDGGEHTP